MARKLFEFRATRARAGGLASGIAYIVWDDEAATVLADISTSSVGSSIAGSTVTTADIAGLGPSACRFYGPTDDQDTLWVTCPSDPSLGVQRVEASADARLDALEAGGGGSVATHAAAADPHPGYVLESLADAKGDLYAASANNAPAKLTVGANGAGLVSDTSQTAGLKWLPPVVFNVKAPPYNAVGDGVANDTAPFQAARDAATATSHTDPAGVASDKVSRAVIEIPAGDYLITSANALMDSAVANPTMGLTIRGAGREVTRVIFDPTDPGAGNAFLFTNVNKWLHVHFEDITFVCLEPNASFAFSYSTAQAQNYTFERVNWWGDWRYGLLLEGTNTNSEMTFDHCGVYGAWATAFLKSGVADVIDEDQFVNYSFYDCVVHIDSGIFLQFLRGGNVNVIGGSYIIIDAAGGKFFDLKGSSHASGTQRFLSQGARFELRNTSSQIIRCEWGRGLVKFDSCDDDSQAPTGSASLIAADFYMPGVEGPVILWENCALQGKHRYNYDGNAYFYAHRVKYDACLISQHPHPDEFIDYVATGGTGNIGGRPQIEFTNCHGNNTNGTVLSTGMTIPFDTVVGWERAAAGQPQRRWVSAKTPQGGSPYVTITTVDVVLPLNAVVVGIVWFMPAGAVGSGNTTWSYVLQTQEGTPTVLDTCALGTALSAGFNRQVAGFFACDSDLKRKLQFIANAAANETATSAVFAVEYLA